MLFILLMLSLASAMPSSSNETEFSKPMTLIRSSENLPLTVNEKVFPVIYELVFKFVDNNKIVRKIDGDTKLFEGALNLTVENQEEHLYIVLYFEYLKITSAHYHHVELHVQQFNRDVVLSVPGYKWSKGTGAIQIRYTGSLVDYTAIDRGHEGNFNFKTLAVETNKGKSYALISGTFPYSLVPCLGEHHNKAYWSVSIIHEAANLAISTAEDDMLIPMGETGYMMTKFAMTPKMSPYGLNIIIGPFIVRRKSTLAKSSVCVYSFSDAVLEKTGVALNWTVTIIEEYEKFLNVSFPLVKLDLVVIPEEVPSSHFGVIYLTEEEAQFDVSDSWEKRIELVKKLSLNVARQWFGHSLSPIRWNDLFLMDAFSGWLSQVGNRKIMGELADKILLNDRHHVMVSEHLVTPSLNGLYPYYHAARKFNTELATLKGAAYLNTAQQLVPEMFLDIVKDFIHRHSFGSFEFGQFIEFFPMTMRKMLRTWTSEHGYAYLRLERKNDTHCWLSQKNFIGYEETAVFETPVFVQRGKDLSPHNYVLTGNYMVISCQQNELIILNANGALYARTNYDDEHWQMIHDQMEKNHSVFSVQTRYQLLSDLIDLTKSKNLNITHLIQNLASFPKEKDLAITRLYLHAWDILAQKMFGYQREGILAKTMLKGLIKRQDLNLTSLLETITDFESYHKKIGKLEQFKRLCHIDFDTCHGPLQRYIDRSLKDCIHKETCPAPERLLKDELACSIVRNLPKSSDLASVKMTMITSSWMNSSTSAAGCKENKEELFTMMHLAINMNRDDWLQSVVNWTSSNKLTGSDFVRFLAIRISGLVKPGSTKIPMDRLHREAIIILLRPIWDTEALKGLDSIWNDLYKKNKKQHMELTSVLTDAMMQISWRIAEINDYDGPLVSALLHDLGEKYEAYEKGGLLE